MAIVSSILVVGACTVAGAAIGGLGTPALCNKFRDKSKPTDGMEAIPQFLIGGFAGAVIGLSAGIYDVRHSGDEDNSKTQIIELDESGLPDCDGNRYVVDNDGQVIGCAFE